MKTVALLLATALAMPAATYYLTVAGLGGEPEYEQRFQSWARSIDRTLRASRVDGHVETLSGDAATRARLRGALETIAGQARPEDALVLLLVGHGTFDGREYKMNLPGPDISAGELAGLLNRIPAARQLVAVMTSASGGALETLRKENRIVITATKSGTEKNAVIFARYWAEALGDPTADTDKNESISALEAYRYAGRKTAEFYESQKRLATEHPLLEDTGRAGGAREPSAENGEGRLASSFILLRFGAAQAAARNPAKQELLAKKEDLERRIGRLKYQKAAMPSDEYRKQLSALLVELAKTQEELDR